jgi:hypothetical protein
MGMIMGGKVGRIRTDPDLDEPEGIVQAFIPLTVPDPGTGAGILHSAALDDFSIPKAVFVNEFPVHAIGDDFNFLVRVHFKSAGRPEGEIIKSHQNSEAGILRILVVSEREMEATHMPAIISEVYLLSKNLG